mmetsp:Transcript_16824/g.39104  ORF Transcript_16824/g.39104 Transcript_16824/m.39104 type:complete len:231 (-) Transcript_16824:345-1037(-)
MSRASHDLAACFVGGEKQLPFDEARPIPLMLPSDDSIACRMSPDMTKTVLLSSRHSFSSAAYAAWGGPSPAEPTCERLRNESTASFMTMVPLKSSTITRFDVDLYADKTELGLRRVNLSSRWVFRNSDTAIALDGSVALSSGASSSGDESFKSRITFWIHEAAEDEETHSISLKLRPCLSSMGMFKARSRVFRVWFKSCGLIRSAPFKMEHAAVNSLTIKTPGHSLDPFT